MGSGMNPNPTTHTLTHTHTLTLTQQQQQQRHCCCCAPMAGQRRWPAAGEAPPAADLAADDGQQEREGGKIESYSNGEDE